MMPDGRRVLYRHAHAGHVVEVIEEYETRALTFDSHLTQSRMLLDEPHVLVLRYTRRMMAGLLFLEAPVADQPFRVLMIGLGGGSLVKFLLHGFARCRMDVVESDPLLPDLARRFFYVPDDPRLNLMVGDGGRFLARLSSEQRYDLILLDAFDQDGMARDVYTDPIFVRAAARLAPQGVLALNLIRTDEQWFRLVVESIGRRFADQVIRLAVPGFSNEILFVGPGLNSWEQRAELHNRAWELAARCELNFPEYVQAMVPLERRAGWKRWLEWVAWQA
ncbi:MAG: spermidine synthase [Magnetococcales bacterium]|nr:fused MFS/spermidine synthase [Magnetococcales bacterium]NGZ07299.1 spermidine synthase [Magnetococcales bacterium]